MKRLFCFLAVLFYCAVGNAATFTVSNLADTNDGTCDSDCSLREAITAANTAAGDDTIDFASGVTGIVQLSGALPDLSSNIALQGPGANSLTVRRDTGGDYRIFTVISSATVSISDLTLTNGNLPSTATPGGGINNAGSLALSNCVITSNNADSGAGIYSSGALTLTGCTISDNTAAQFAGAFIFPAPI